MSEKTFAISTGAVYRFAQEGNVNRLLTTLDLAEQLTGDGEFGPVGIEIMLLKIQPLSELNMYLRQKPEIRDRIRNLGGIMSVHADRPEIYQLNFPPRLPPGTLVELKKLVELTEAKHVVWHAGWGHENEVLESSLPIVLENEDSVSAGAKSTNDLLSIKNQHPSAKFLLDTAHWVENFGDQSIVELQELLVQLAPHILAFHISATEGAHNPGRHMPLVDSTNTMYRTILKHLPYNAHRVIESPVSPHNPLEAMKTEMRLACST